MSQDYAVVIDYKINFDSADRPASKLAEMGGALSNLRGGAGELSGSLKELGSKLSETFTEAVEKAGELAMHFGMLAATAGAGALAYGVAHLNNELEQTEISLAAVFNSQGLVSNFVEGTQLASEQIAKMKQDIRTLPGDLGQLANIMKQISIPGAAGGADADALRKMAGQSMLAGGIAGIQDMNTVGRQMQMLLNGRAGARIQLGTSLGFSGEKAKELNAASPEQRVKMIQAALEHAIGESGEAFGRSWVAQVTTLKDNLKYTFLAPLTEPLFKRVKGSLAEVNGWFDQHHDGIEKWTHIFGERLADAWQTGVDKFKEWLPAITQFAEDAYHRIRSIWDRIQPTVEKVSDAIAKSLSNGSALDKIEGILKLYGAVKLGGMAASAAPMAKGLIGGGAEAFVSLGLGGLPALVASLAALTATAAVGVGVFDDLTNKSSLFYDQANKSWGQIQTNFGGIMTELEKDGKDLWSALRPLADLMGQEFLNSILGITYAIKGAMMLFQPYIDLAKTLGLIDRDFGQNANGSGLRGVKEDTVSKGFGKSFADSLSKSTLNAIKAGAGGGGGGTVIHAEINVSSNNADPERVARLVPEKLAEIQRYRKSSPFVPNYSAARGARS